MYCSSAPRSRAKRLKLILVPTSPLRFPCPSEVCRGNEVRGSHAPGAISANSNSRGDTGGGCPLPQKGPRVCSSRIRTHFFARKKLVCYCKKEIIIVLKEEITF